jgi:hypothetical protein
VLRSGELDIGLARERPVGEFDAMLVLRENLGVLLASELAAGLVGPEGLRLDSLSGLQWLGFPRSNSPAWHDEITAILRTSPPSGTVSLLSASSRSSVGAAAVASARTTVVAHRHVGFHPRLPLPHH